MQENRLLLKTECDSKVISRECVAKLKVQLEKDNVRAHWNQISVFLGKFGSTVKPNDIGLRIVHGALGEGAIDKENDNIIVIEFPDEKGALEDLQRDLSDAGVDLSDDEAVELLYSIEAQTVLHEGTHVLINSKPGSIFAQTLEQIGFENQEGRDSTLLDEGLTYAIQNYFAPNTEKLGKLVVRSYTAKQLKDETDPEIKKVQRRKLLGNILTPLVSEYFDAGKAIVIGTHFPEYYC